MNATIPNPPSAPQSPMLPEFSHMPRFWDPQAGSWTVKILPGEYYVTRGDEAISTVLGSCISVCIRDRECAVGGMNHFMLPADLASGTDSWLDPDVGLATRYGSYAMESLVNLLLKHGACRERLEIKVFGGGRVLSGMTDVGARNIAFIRNYVRLEGLRIAAEDLGGTQPRKLLYFPASGRARMRKLRPVENRSVSHHEQLYLASIRGQIGGEVELFGEAPLVTRNGGKR